MQFETILCPVDFSPSSQHALELAASMASSGGGRLLLVHVVEPEIPYSSGYNYLTAAEKATEVKRLLDQVRPSHSQVPLERFLLHGDVARALIDYAKSHPVGLIVIGTHGRSGLSRLMLGSVAEHLLRHAPCGVVAVRMPPGPAT